MATHAPETFVKKLVRGLKEAGWTHDAQDIADAVAAGKMQCWQNNGSMVITEVVQFPRDTILNIFLIVGDFDDIMELHPEVEAFGREHGCSSMRMVCRKGFRDLMPKYGWKQEPKLIFQKEL